MQTVSQKQYNKLMAILAFVWLAGFLSACSEIRLISDYDEETDKAVTQLHRKVEGFLLELEDVAGTPDGEYKNYRDVYKEVKVDLASLSIRAKARPKNSLQVDQLELLSRSWNTLENLHKTGLTPEQLPPLRSAFNVSFTAILKLEFELKRGQ